jgi:hypothetical protein
MPAQKIYWLTLCACFVAMFISAQEKRSFHMLRYYKNDKEQKIKNAEI